MVSVDLWDDYLFIKHNVSLNLFLIHSIIQPLCKVSETVVFQLDSLHLPINLYKFSHEYKKDNRILFEPELFPSLSLHYWKPLHVNVFSTGKVIILGFNASHFVSTIRDWINIHLIIL